MQPVLQSEREEVSAEVLLKLARMNDPAIRQDVQIPRFEPRGIGGNDRNTSRSYTTRAMVRFRRMGLIEYSGYVQHNPSIIVRTGLLTDKILEGVLPD